MGILEKISGLEAVSLDSCVCTHSGTSGPRTRRGWGAGAVKGESRARGDGGLWGHWPLPWGCAS